MGVSRNARLAALLLALPLAASCREPTAPPSYVPQDLELRYEWELRGWNGLQPAGEPVVRLQWPVPSRWAGEPFRVYGKRASQQSYVLVGTVTACSPIRCRYDDSDVRHGETYDYYVAALNESTGAESPSTARRIAVPALPSLQVPDSPRAHALDRAVYLRWNGGGDGATFWKYLIFLTALDGESALYQVGESDGAGFVDLQVQNAVSYGYRVAAVDTFGHVSQLSAEALASPRPGGSGVVVLAHAADPQRSGFRFPAVSGEDPVVPGGSGSSRWRLQEQDGSWTLHPEGGALVGPGVATTALSCGPGSGPECTALTTAPADGYASTPMPLQVGHTYPLRYAAGGETFFAKVRVAHLGYDAGARALAVVEWAHQLRPGDRTLSVTP